MSFAADNPSPRRQERGLRRMEAILDVAEKVIAEVGYEGATTNLIAARAGISPGSLYQFFGNRNAIVEGLVGRYLTLLLGLREVLLVGTSGRALPDVIDGVLNPILAFHMAHPAARFLLAAGPPELRAATAPLHGLLCDQVGLLLDELAPNRLPDERRVASRVTIDVFNALLPLYVHASDEGERGRVHQELRRLLHAYWGDLAGARLSP